jgi:hypothetical protein
MCVRARARACVFFQKPNALCFLVFSYIIIVAAAALLADLFVGRLLTSYIHAEEENDQGAPARCCSLFIEFVVQHYYYCCCIISVLLTSQKGVM